MSLYAGEIWYACTEFEMSGLVREQAWHPVDVFRAAHALMAAGLTDKECADILAASEYASGHLTVCSFVDAVLQRRKE